MRKHILSKRITGGVNGGLYEHPEKGNTLKEQSSPSQDCSIYLRDMLFTGYGKLHYHTSWLMLYADDEIGRYYRALLKSYEPWLQLNIPMHGMHVTVVPGKYETPPNQNLWGKYEGEVIPFEYDGDVTHWHDFYYGIRVYCQRIEDIREELGLPRVLPVFWHITIGNTKGIDTY